MAASDLYLVIKFCQAKMGGIVPDYKIYSDENLERHKQEVNGFLSSYLANMEAIRLRAGLADVLHISA